MTIKDLIESGIDFGYACVCIFADGDKRLTFAGDLNNVPDEIPWYYEYPVVGIYCMDNEVVIEVNGD